MQNKLTDGNKRATNIKSWLGVCQGLSEEMHDFSTEKIQALFGVSF